MLGEALFLGGGAPGAAEFAGMTRADLPAAPTGALRPGEYDPAGYEQGPGPRPPGNRRRWATAGLTPAPGAAPAPPRPRPGPPLPPPPPRATPNTPLPPPAP